MTKQNELTVLDVYFDGGTVHGSFIIIENGMLVKRLKYDMIGTPDSNQGEFTVLLRALRRIHADYHPEHTAIHLYGDNELLRQSVGAYVAEKWQGKQPEQEVLQYLRDRIRERLEKFFAWSYKRVSRKKIESILGH
jgi:ribonuclease HI